MHIEAFHPYTFPWHDTPLAWLTAEQARARVEEITREKPAAEVPSRLRCFQRVPEALVIGIPPEYARLRDESARLWEESASLWKESASLWKESASLRAKSARLWDERDQAALALRVVPDAPWRDGALRFDGDGEGAP